MRIAGALLYLFLVAIAFASGLPRYTFWWFALVDLSVALFVATLVRVHAVVNAPRKDS